MRSKSFILVPLVIGLAMVLFFIYGVRAQSETPPGNPANQQSQPDAAAVVEAEPRVSTQTDATTQPWTTEDGKAPASPVSPLKEFDPAFKLGESSQSPSAVNWNTSVRFVGSTLRPRKNDVNYTTNGYGSCVYITSGNAGTVWNLPLALPEGSKVQWLRLYYYDKDTKADGQNWGYFTKYDLNGVLVNEWGVHSIDGVPGSNYYGYQDVLITPTETIDYNYYSYVLNWIPEVVTNTLQLCGFRVFYQAPITSHIFMPVLQK